jgi:rhodanese-related sulfurtransferase
MAHNPGFLSLVDAARARVREVTVDAAATAAADPARPRVLIDVREDHEWDVGHPAGAVHLGRGILERDIETVVPDRGAPLALLCGGGYRSALAAAVLQDMGYTDVVSVAGGWKAWVAAGLPVSSGS